MSALREALKSFDGKAISLLAEARAKFGDRPRFLSELVRLAADDEAQISSGATWLIKDHLDHGDGLTARQTEDLMGSLDAVTSWQAQLHICQSVRRLEMPPHLARACADWLTPLLCSDRPFLRAWSMDALQHLAGQSADLAARAEAALKAAEDDPAASVRARARHWRKTAKHC